MLDLGAPVTSLSLSPAMEMLATTHPEHNSIFLWSNNTIYSSSSDVAVSRGDTPVRARLQLPRLGQTKVRPGRRAKPRTQQQGYGA